MIPEPGRGGGGGIADDAADGAKQGGQQQLGRGAQFRSLAGDQGKAERAPLRVAEGTDFRAIAAT